MNASLQPAIDHELLSAFEHQRDAFSQDMNPSFEKRMDRLERVGRMTSQHADAIVAAIAQDFGHRSSHETLLAEILMVNNTLKHTRSHLRGWMKPKRVPTAMMYRPGYSRLLCQPLGVIGIISPWNYPYQLAIVPAIAALAAGNRVMIKPSEITPKFSALLQHIVAESFAADELIVLPGDVSRAKSFADLPFDHLLYTGSTAVGRQVAAAAARNLTPVTLELGGKSPAIIDSDAKFDTVASRLTFGKLFNAGQTCIAPDYALVPRARLDEFANAVKQAATRMFPSLANNPDYTAIVSDRHYQRLRNLIEDARGHGARVMEINAANESLEPGRRKLAPTLILNASDNMRVMQEEIFGPILPVVPYDSLHEAIRYVNQHDRPLALYWFGDNDANRDQVLSQTISGGVTVNDCMLHVAQEDLPFGGVGPSGQGAYHGEYGFRTFSKEKPIFYQSKFSAGKLMQPPYGKFIDRMLNAMKGK
jgi:coniferyl-aldehyde dehydrogenase